MITHEQAAKLKMGDKLIAYRNAHVRMGEATPVEFEPCLVLCVPRENPQVRQMENFAADAPGDPAQAEELRSCRIMVAFHDGTTQMLRGGRLFLTMADASDAVDEDILDIERMTNAVGAAWNAYFNANADIDRGPGHVDCPCTVEPREATKGEVCIAALREDLSKCYRTITDLRAQLAAIQDQPVTVETYEKRAIDTVHEMGIASLSPEAFTGLLLAIEQLRKNRHLG